MQGPELLHYISVDWSMPKSVHVAVQSQQTGVKPVEWVDLERVDNEMQRLSHETRELYNLMTPAFGTSERIKKKIAAIETGLADARAEIKAQETGLAEVCAQIKAQQAVFEDVCAQVKAQQDIIKHLQQAMQQQGRLDTPRTSVDSACFADVRAEILHGLTQHLMRLPASASPCMPPEVNSSSLAGAKMQAGSKRTFLQTQAEFADPTWDANVAKLRKVLVKTDNPADHVLVSDLCTSVFDDKLSAKQVSELFAVVIDTKRIGLIDVYEKYLSSRNPDADPKWIAVGREHGKKGWVLDTAMLAAMREEVKATDM